jgi:hypothetical protein
MGLDAQSGFEQPDIFIPGAKEAFYSSADAYAGFHQVGVGYLQTEKKRRQGLPLNREGFETSTARWHGLQNTIHVYYTEVSSPRASRAPNRDPHHPGALVRVNCEGDRVTEPDPQPQTDYSEDGVDLTLIRWMLSLTPAERLQVLQRQVDAILAVRRLNAGR